MICSLSKAASLFDRVPSSDTDTATLGRPLCPARCIVFNSFGTMACLSSVTYSTVKIVQIKDKCLGLYCALMEHSHLQ